MNKDAYYFPHFSNARHDRRLKRVRKELGVEGYGIYFMILETLRDQEQFKYPLDDVDLLADEFGTSEQKVRTVICNYKLFQVDENQNFFSLRFVEYLQPYLDNKHRNRINGIKGNLIRYGYITKDAADSMNDAEILELNEHRQTLMLLPSGAESGGEQPSDRKESKVKESKVNNIYGPVVEYLNEKSGKSYRSTTKKTQDCIRARQNEGFELEDFRQVIDIKCKQWKGTNMEQYLRPETLFGNKFEGYLNEKSNSTKPSSIRGGNKGVITEDDF